MQRTAVRSVDRRHGGATGRAARNESTLCAMAMKNAYAKRLGELCNPARRGEISRPEKPGNGEVMDAQLRMLLQSLQSGRRLTIAAQAVDDDSHLMPPGRQTFGQVGDMAKQSPDRCTHDLKDAERFMPHLIASVRE